MAGFGPLGPRAATVRPTKTTDTYLVQTWFQDCTAPGAQDGTVPDASWFNHIIGNLVYAAAQYGVTLTNDQDDDTFVYDIIEAAIAASLPAQTATWGQTLALGSSGLALYTDAGYPDHTVVTSAENLLLKAMAAVGMIGFTESATTPVSPSRNDIWFKPDTGLAAAGAPAGDATYQRYNGSTWETLTPGLWADYILELFATLNTDGVTLTGNGITTALAVDTTALDVFTSSLAGIVPASGGGATNFLRADGTWAAPSGGGGGVSDGDYGDIDISGGVWSVDTNVVTNAKMAQAAPYTLKMNPTGSTADLQDVDISTLDDIGTPGASDELIIRDASAGGALKRVSATAIPGAAGGAFQGPGAITETWYNTVGGVGLGHVRTDGNAAGMSTITTWQGTFVASGGALSVRDLHTGAVIAPTKTFKVWFTFSREYFPDADDDDETGFDCLLERTA